MMRGLRKLKEKKNHTDTEKTLILFFPFTYLMNEHKKNVIHLLIVQALTITTGILIGTFSLIYLLRYGFSREECAIFIALCYFFAFLFALFIKYNGIKNTKSSIVFSMFFAIFYYSSLVLLINYKILLLIISPIIFGIYLMYFWMPFNSLLIKQTEKNNRGTILSISMLLFPLANVLAPFLGGILIVYGGGYLVMFFTAFLLIFINIIFIYSSKRIESNKILPFKKFDTISNKLKFGLFSQGFEEGVIFTALPLTIFFFAKEEFSFGILFSLFALFGAITTLILGIFSDRMVKKRSLFLKLGVILSSPFLILAGLINFFNFANELIEFSIFINLFNLFTPIIPTFLFALIIDLEEHAKNQAIITRDVFLNIGRVFGALICIVSLFLGNLFYSFVFAGIVLILIIVFR